MIYWLVTIVLTEINISVIVFLQYIGELQGKIISNPLYGEYVILIT